MKTTKHSKGYVLIYKPEHPLANGQGYVPEHRLVVEDKIGRLINVLTEEVHHVDGDVTNNHPDNLQLLTRREHRRVHAGWFKIGEDWYKTCQTCKRELRVEGNFYVRHSTGAHNECVSECKECLARKSRETPGRTVMCPDCGKMRIVKLNATIPAKRCHRCATTETWRNGRRVR